MSMRNEYQCLNDYPLHLQNVQWVAIRFRGYLVTNRKEEIFIDCLRLPRWVYDKHQHWFHLYQCKLQLKHSKYYVSPSTAFYTPIEFFIPEEIKIKNQITALKRVITNTQNAINAHIEWRRQQELWYDEANDTQLNKAKAKLFSKQNELNKLIQQ